MNFLREAWRAAPIPADRRIMSAWWDRESSVVGSVFLARQLRKLCPVPGARVSDYVARILKLSDGASALVRVRFRRGDAAWPYVHWVACDRPFKEARDVARRAGEAMEAFAALKPQAMRIWIPKDAAWAPKAGKSDRWLAAPVDALRKQPPLALPPGFSVERSAAKEIHSRYAREYRKFIRENPESKDWIRVESPDSLRLCERQGALFVLKSGRKVCGLVALRREATPWFDGWCVVESHLFEGFRGRGLAAPLHRSAYERLPARRGDYVWGTIDPGNRRSLATARRVGRVEIGGDWLITA